MRGHRLNGGDETTRFDDTFEQANRERCKLKKDKLSKSEFTKKYVKHRKSLYEIIHG